MKTVFVFLVSCGFACRLGAQSPVPAASAQTLPCSGLEFRQFDFWLGRSSVSDPTGKVVGKSEISRASEGCAIRENWTSASGQQGMSINYFDPEDHQWHQDWVGADGTILHLIGGLKDGAMIMTGKSVTPKGTMLNRIAWTPLPDSRMKQEWSSSTDDGMTWKIAFVGLYTKGEK